MMEFIFNKLLRLKFFIIVGLLAVNLFIVKVNALTVPELLPRLGYVVKPLTTAQIDQNIKNILKVMNPECARINDKTKTEVKELLIDACLLAPAYKKIDTLSKLVIDPKLSPISFPMDIAFPTYDLVKSGAWRKGTFSQAADIPRLNPFQLTTEIILTKVTIEKALYSYGQLAVIWSGDVNVNAKVYLVPKLIQSLESQTILESLTFRYQFTPCSITQMWDLPKNMDLCQLEKERTAYVISQLIEGSRQNINKVLLEVNSLQKNADSISLNQIGELVTISDTITQLNATDIKAREIWQSVVGNKENGIDPKWRGLLEAQFAELKKIPIQFSNLDEVNVYVFATYMLGLEKAIKLETQVGVVGEFYKEVDPKIDTNSDLQNILNQSQTEITKIGYAIDSYIKQQNDINGGI